MRLALVGVVAAALGALSGFLVGSRGDGAPVPNPYSQPPVSGSYVEVSDSPRIVADSWGIECGDYALVRVDERGLYACDFSTPSPWGE